MNRKNMGAKIIAVVAAAFIAFLAITPRDVMAKTYTLPDGTVFDSDFYAALYPEMQAGYAGGKYPERLLWHYLTYGIKEGRIPSLYTMCNPTPAYLSTPYIYPAGTYSVVPVQYLYPYYPYVY